MVVAEAFVACRARLPRWQSYWGSGVETRHVPFRADSRMTAAAA